MKVAKEIPKIITVEQDWRARSKEDKTGFQEGGGRSSEPSEHLESILVISVHI